MYIYFIIKEETSIDNYLEAEYHYNTIVFASDDKNMVSAKLIELKRSAIEKNNKFRGKYHIEYRISSVKKNTDIELMI